MNREIYVDVGHRWPKAGYKSENVFQKIKAKPAICYCDENSNCICFDKNKKPKFITRDGRVMQDVF